MMLRDAFRADRCCVRSAITTRCEAVVPHAEVRRLVWCDHEILWPVMARSCVLFSVLPCATVLGRQPLLPRGTTSIGVTKPGGSNICKDQPCYNLGWQGPILDCYHRRCLQAVSQHPNYAVRPAPFPSNCQTAIIRVRP
jgi:hypothetical protein